MITSVFGHSGLRLSTEYNDMLYCILRVPYALSDLRDLHIDRRVLVQSTEYSV